MKNKHLSIVLSLLFPGFGHLYIGKYVDGACFIVGAMVLYYALFTRSWYLMTFDNTRSYLVWGTLVFIYLYAMIDSYIKSGKIYD